MRLTYQYVVNKFNELANFVYNCESAISNTIKGHDDRISAEDDQHRQTLQKSKSTYEQDRKSLIRKAENMMEDALEMSGEISQIERSLLHKDKYYKKTKAKKEEELRTRVPEGYREDCDYFDMLDKIRVDFEAISKKYRENILPGILNGIHYFFSSKRKADYEELIVLSNSVDVFIGSIRGNIDQIKKDALRRLEREYNDRTQFENRRHEKELERIDSAFTDDITELTEVIGETLNQVFPDSLVNEMVVYISEYQDALNRVYDKRMGTKSYLSLFGVYLPMDKLGASGPVYQFIIDKLEQLIINTEAGDFLLMPALGTVDKESNWYFEWDNRNRDFVHQLACDVMYSALTRVPVGHLKFNIVDPVGRGSSIRSYYDARKKVPELFSERIFFNGQDIDAQLNRLCDYIDNVSQRILGTRYNSIFEYADMQDEYVPEIIYLCIFDFPKGMSDSSLELLNNITLQGPKCGVYTIIAESYDELDIRHSSLFNKNLSEIKSRSTYVKVQGQKTVVGDTSVTILSQMPSKQGFANYMDRYLLIRESINNRGIVFPNMIKPLILSDSHADIMNQMKYINGFKYVMEENACLNVEDEILIPEAIGIGEVQYPIALFEDSIAYEEIIKEYSNYSNFATLPFSIDLDDDLNLAMISSEGDYQRVVDFSHNIIWSYLSAIPASAFNVCIIDPEGRGRNAIPFIDFSDKRPEVFCGGILSASDKIRAQMRKFVTHIDEVTMKRLGSKYNNIHEYNQSAVYGIEPITLLVIYDFQKALDSASMNDLLNIIRNGNRCGIYTLLCGVSQDEKDASRAKILEEIYSRCTMLEPFDEYFRLVPYNVMLSPRKHLAQYQSDSFISQYITALEIVDERAKNRAPENNYAALFDLKNAPDYKRGNKKIHLPYGISADGELYYCDFESDNFAAFLCGSSGSGKSTLIHSLITGILRNNHPDDVELWLADFKMKEFRRYVKNRPPHIKYILLEESADAVYDFLDRMKEKLSERERMNSSYTDFTKAPVSQYMPLIFVIIDEFSIMSQIVERSEEYKLVLQNLLAKGRALGFRFLFSSQTFTTGISGLTSTAKKQIQMRLAMKCPQVEIEDTIDMNKSLMNDEQKRWLLTLPKHYILLKKILGEGDTVTDGKVQDEVVLTRAKGLYFPEDKLQTDFIEVLNNAYTPVESYRASEITTYQDKKAVVVDGSKYYAFEDVRDSILERLDYVEETDEYADESIRLFLGRPRSMHALREVVVENEFEENVILFGQEPELMTSVYLSSMASANLCGAVVSVIGHKKNRIYRKLSTIGIDYADEFITDEEEICKLIHDVKIDIEKGVTNKQLLVIVGLDTILKNVIFMADSSSKSGKTARKLLSGISLEGVFGNDPEDMSLEDKLKPLEQELGITVPSVTNYSSKLKSVAQREQADENEYKGIYDIRADLELILKEGPRFGCHVFTGFRTYNEFKQTRLKMDYFKHRLTFQTSKEDSLDIVGRSIAFSLGERAFMYTDMQKSFSMRPYLHKGLEWDGWTTDDDGYAVGPEVVEE